MIDLIRGAFVPPLLALRWSVLLFALLRAMHRFGQYRRLRQGACLRTPLWPCPKPAEGHEASVDIFVQSQVARCPVKA